MEVIYRQAGLEKIAETVANGGRISGEEALQLFACRDLHAVGLLADQRRQKLNGNRASYLHNRYINYSNICILNCQFCAFARRRRDPGAFELTVEEMVALAKEAVAGGATELHIVGGLHPALPFSYYLEMLRALRAVDPGLHLKVFTAIEIRHLADRIAQRPLRDTLESLREAGLGSLTGGGAEIFDPSVRNQICRGKETAEEWLETHRIWHEMGGRSTCTMLYGHVETLAQRVNHLARLRALQDETRGFTGFIPLPFQPEGHELSHLRRTSALDDLRNMAVARIFLDNIPHITAYWVGLGLGLAQVALAYGADDLHGTIVEERIFHMAGAETPQGVTLRELEQRIRETGREPFQRDSYYLELKAGQAAPIPLESFT
jgi:aminodeoxyfutalosine synthase